MQSLGRTTWRGTSDNSAINTKGLKARPLKWRTSRRYREVENVQMKRQWLRDEWIISGRYLISRSKDVEAGNRKMVDSRGCRRSYRAGVLHLAATSDGQSRRAYIRPWSQRRVGENPESVLGVRLCAQLKPINMSLKWLVGPISQSLLHGIRTRAPGILTYQPTAY